MSARWKREADPLLRPGLGLELELVVFNPMRLPGTSGLSYCGGFYRHQMVRTDAGWKSRKLVEENVWFEAATGGPR